MTKTLKMYTGFRKEWIENCTTFNKKFKHFVEVESEVLITPCEKCPCYNFDLEVGGNCNLGFTTNTYTTVLGDYSHSCSDRYEEGSLDCKMLQVTSETKTIKKPSPITAFVVQRGYERMAK